MRDFIEFHQIYFLKYFLIIRDCILIVLYAYWFSSWWECTLDLLRILTCPKDTGTAAYWNFRKNFPLGKPALSNFAKWGGLVVSDVQDVYMQNLGLLEREIFWIASRAVQKSVWLQGRYPIKPACLWSNNIGSSISWHGKNRLKKA